MAYFSSDPEIPPLVFHPEAFHYSLSLPPAQVDRPTDGLAQELDSDSLSSSSSSSSSSHSFIPEYECGDGQSDSIFSSSQDSSSAESPISSEGVDNVPGFDHPLAWVSDVTAAPMEMVEMVQEPPAPAAVNVSSSAVYVPKMYGMKVFYGNSTIFLRVHENETTREMFHRYFVKKNRRQPLLDTFQEVISKVIARPTEYSMWLASTGVNLTRPWTINAFQPVDLDTPLRNKNQPMATLIIQRYELLHAAFHQDKDAWDSSKVILCEGVGKVCSMILHHMSHQDETVSELAKKLKYASNIHDAVCVPEVFRILCPITECVDISTLNMQGDSKWIVRLNDDDKIYQGSSALTGAIVFTVRKYRNETMQTATMMGHMHINPDRFSVPVDLAKRKHFEDIRTEDAKKPKHPDPYYEELYCHEEL